MSRRITDAIAEMVATALAEQGHDEIDFEVGLAAIPGPNGQPQGILVITFVISAVTLGDNHAGSIMLQPAIPPQDVVNDLVRQLATGIKEARSRQAEQLLAQSNGHKDTQGVSGLILPS